MPVLDARYLDDADPAELAALSAILRSTGLIARKPRATFTVPRSTGRVEGVRERRDGRPAGMPHGNVA